MPREKLYEERYDFSAGLIADNNNVSVPLNSLFFLGNVRLDSVNGALQPRGGSQRTHQTILPGIPRGIFQWEAPGGRQEVVINDGDLYHRLVTIGNWSTVSPATAISTTNMCTFATMRADTSGAPLKLYFADGVNLWEWDGTSTLTKLSGTSNCPSNVDLVVAFHNRLFVHTTDYKNHVFWSKLGSPTVFTVGGKVDGGSAMVDVLRGEGITAMKVTGSTLAIGTESSIARFRGYADDDINIQRDTEGISATAGPAGKQAMASGDKFGAFISATGQPFLFDEQQIVYIGDPIQGRIKNVVKPERISESIVLYVEHLREIWFCYNRSTDNPDFLDWVFAYSLDLKAWVGEFSFPNVEFSCLTISRDPDDNIPYVLAGVNVPSTVDGWVVHLDDTTLELDNVLYDDSGGSSFTSAFIINNVWLGRHDGRRKVLRHIMMQMRIEVGTAITLTVSPDSDQPTSTDTVTYNLTTTAESLAAGPHRFDVNVQGERFRLHFAIPSTSNPAANTQWKIFGFAFMGHDMGGRIAG